jgi:hypothetical protein
MNKYISINKRNAKHFYDLCEFALAYIDQNSIRRPGICHVIMDIKNVTNAILNIQTRDGKI